MNIRIASAALPLLWLALGTAGCDRREAEPIEPSDTADTVMDDTPATATTDVPDTTTDPATTASGALPTTDTCAGLTGEAEAECRMRNNDGLPPTPPPVNPEEESGDDAPPAP